MSRLDVRYSRAFKTPVAALAVTAVAALLITGCSGADRQDPKGSGSKPTSGAAGASPGALKDESASVVAWTPPAPVARTEGKLEFSVHGQTRPATAEIISVQASDASTIQTWQISSATDIPLQGYSLPPLTGPGSSPTESDSSIRRSRSPMASTPWKTYLPRTASVRHTRSTWVVTL